MNLILQGLVTSWPTIKRIASLAGAQRITPIHAHAWRCEGVEYSVALKTRIDALCFAEQLDNAFIAPGRALSDFKLLAMDMDSTLITIECIDEIADMQGLKPQVAEITEAAMRGDIEFRESLTRRVELLKGLDADALQRVYDERVQLSPGAEAMLAGMRNAGLKTLLVSGGFTYFTDRIKQQVGLDYAHSNLLEIVNGKLTGRISGRIVDEEEKKWTVKRICAELGISTQQTIVMGDGANDLKMMRIAGLSVAFRAKPLVRAQADVALNFVGLDGTLALFEA
ncbi:MAG TPA: phosphoserine phosphatase SerB [Burkholderiaceae bacterium]|nr:phosphoserine phosphatase SerB [Burkholderiaceae bacterium]